MAADASGPEAGFTPVDDDHIRREKAKARELRQSQWWKNACGRGQCHYCGAKVHPHDLTMDHVVPIIRGGCSSRHNVVPSCKDCNSRKRYLVPVEWAEYLESLRNRGSPQAGPPRDRSVPERDGPSRNPEHE